MGSRSAPSRARAEPAKLSPLEQWGLTQEYGWRTRLRDETKPANGDRPPLGWATVMRACKGIKVNLSTAKRISKATRGAVPYWLLTDERDEDLEEVA